MMAGFDVHVAKPVEPTEQFLGEFVREMNDRVASAQGGGEKPK